MDKSVLVLIDVQKGFDDPVWGRRNNLDAEKNIGLLLAEWRRRSWPIVHVRHCSSESDSPLRAGQPGYDFKDEAIPRDGEEVFTKEVNSAFIGTQLEEFLRVGGCDSLVLVGLTTDHCVSTSARMAGNLGFQVRLVSDATATFDRIGHDGRRYLAEEIHAIHLASLDREFGEVRSTIEVMSEMA